MSGLGQKQTLSDISAMSALPPKADMVQHNRDVRFVPITGREQLQKIGAYSITSSARARSDDGTSRPSAFAVLRLMTSSYLVAVCTGRSTGFSPLRRNRVVALPAPRSGLREPWLIHLIEQSARPETAERKQPPITPTWGTHRAWRGSAPG
jgi:hypothetical protein